VANDDGHRTAAQEDRHPGKLALMTGQPHRTLPVARHLHGDDVNDSVIVK